jgi:hypothetical protein
VSATSDPTQWIKAKRSNGANNCVEMRENEGLVQVRDSKQNGEGPMLGFTKAEIAAWIDGAKNGEFDHLI